MLLRHIYILVFILHLTTTFAQSVLSELQSISTYNEKYDYLQRKQVSIDSIQSLLKTTNHDEDRLELLILYLSKQFLIDMNDVYPEFDEAFQLAHSTENKLNKASMYRYNAMMKALDLKREEALLYLDTAQWIINDLDDKVFESFIEYSRHIVYKFTDQHSKAIHFLLKSYELSRKYASQNVLFSRERMVIDYALDFKAVNALQLILDRRNIDQIPSEYQSFYLVSKSLCFDMLGKQDSAFFYAKKSYETFKDKRSYFNYAKMLAKDSNYVEALSVFNELIEMKNPKESFFNNIYDEISSIYMSMDSFELAKYYCKNSILQSIKMNELNREVEGLNKMAFLFWENGDFDSSFHYANKALEYARERDFTSSYAQSLRLQKKYFEQTNQEKKALEAANLLLEINSDLSVLSIQNSMETNLIESEIGSWYNDQKQQLESTRSERNSLGILALFCMVVICLIILLLYQKSKSLKIQIQQSKELELQNDKIHEQQLLLQKINQEQDQIIHNRTKNLVELNTTLDLRNKRLELFSNIASHNLRGPISNLISLTSILRSKTTDTDQIVLNMMYSVSILDNVMNLLNTVLELDTHHIDEKEEILVEELLKEYTSNHFCIHHSTFRINENQLITNGELMKRILTLIDHRLLKMHHDNKSLIYILTAQQDKGVFSLSIHQDSLNLKEIEYERFEFEFNASLQSSLIDLYIIHLLCERIQGDMAYSLKSNELSAIHIHFPVHSKI